MEAVAVSQTEPTWTAAQLRAFGKECDALRDQVLADLGEQDARYIQRIVAIQRWAEITGRGCLFVGILPPAFLAGTGLLALSKILENMEIGHNVLHGQYDWMNDASLNSQTYEWDWACPAASWRHSHNYIHHTFTNIVGKDRDVGYALLRMADSQKWHWLRVPQPVYAFGQMFLFEWAVAVHDLEGERLLRREKSPAQFLQELWPVVRKGSTQLFKDFVFFPALAGPFAPWVWTGNLSANVIRNVWAFLVIYCGHFPEEVHMFKDDPQALSFGALEGGQVDVDVDGQVDAKSGEPDPEVARGAWYLRQVLGSANIEGPHWLHVLSGHLSRQVEHHLFPDLPANRYDELAPQVRALCEKYGVPYHTGPLHRQVAGAVRRIVRLALPQRAAAAS